MVKNAKQTSTEIQLYFIGKKNPYIYTAILSQQSLNTFVCLEHEEQKISIVPHLNKQDFVYLWISENICRHLNICFVFMAWFENINLYGSDIPVAGNCMAETSGSVFLNNFQEEVNNLYLSVSMHCACNFLFPDHTGGIIHLLTHL